MASRRIGWLYCALGMASAGSAVVASKLAGAGLPVFVAEDPLTCVVRGCGIALEQMERLGSIFTSE